MYGLDMASGPGLIFATLPKLFSQMPMGRFVGSLFLSALAAVAFLSLIAAYQVLVGSIDKKIFPNAKRNRIIITLGVLQAILTLPSSLYPNLIGILDLVFGSGMGVFGSVLAVLGVTWGLGRAKTLNHIFGDEESSALRNFTFLWLRWVVPAVLVLVLSGYIVSKL